ncbi:MAG: hypothetical protein COA74_13970 [Gammaproteobacteria bacterium]|nr:MAG: hypothetical protein COA74_13970 [Gammaproteobacteria bacterium]
MGNKIIRLLCIIFFSVTLFGCVVAKGLAQGIALELLCEPSNVHCEGPYEKHERPEDRSIEYDKTKYKKPSNS